MIVMTSHYEGFGMVLVEAMLCGVPAIAFNCKCGPKDIIDDGRNGLLVPEGDVPALADAMKKLMRDEALRQKMGAEALKIRDKYSEERVMDSWVRLFESLVK